MDIPVHVHVYGRMPTRCSLPVPGAVHMRSACAVRAQCVSHREERGACRERWTRRRWAGCVSHREVCKAAISISHAPLLPVGSSADICDGGGCAYAHLFV